MNLDNFGFLDDFIRNAKLPFRGFLVSRFSVFRLSFFLTSNFYPLTKQRHGKNEFWIVG